MAKFKERNGDAVLEVYDLDFQGRHYPYLTTKLYKKANLFETDIPGLALDLTNDNPKFIYNNVSYPFTGKQKTKLDLSNFDNDAFRQFLSDLKSFLDRDGQKVLPNSGFFTRSAVGFLNKKMYEQGLALNDIGIRLMPNIYTLYYFKAEFLLAEGKKEEALAEYRKAASLMIEDQDLNNKIAGLQKELNRGS